MEDAAAKAEVFEQLRRVIAWEIDSQIGINRAVEHRPALIADTLLDYFVVSMRPGVDTTDL